MGQIDGEREEGEAGFGRKGGREGEREEESRRGRWRGKERVDI